MRKVLYLSVGASLLMGIGAAHAQFTDNLPPPQITFSRSPRTMAEEALNESRRNRPEPVYVEKVVVEESKGPENLIKMVEEVSVDKAPETVVEVTVAPTQPTEYEEVIKIPRKKKDVFDVINTSQSGEISKEEYDVFAMERANKMFVDMDTDSNGKISREEFNGYRLRGK